MAFPRRSAEYELNQKLDRKLIRSSLPEFKHPSSRKSKTKPAPPEQTNAENFYYLKQMNSKTPMIIVMNDGEEVRGWIEWYDKTCLKLNREDAPNLLIQKHWIKYVFKQEDE